MISFFREGGFGMWIILFIGFAAIVLGIAYAATKERALRLPAAGVALATLVVAGLFWWHALNVVGEALAAVEPSMQAQLEEAGRSEAARNLQLGGGLFIIAAIATAAGDLRRRAADSR